MANRFGPFRDHSRIGGTPAKGRRSTGATTTCEALDGRQLLTTMNSMASAAIFTPPAAVVTEATVILDGANPAAFQKYAIDLAHAEESSRVTPSQFNALALDTATLDLAIERSGLDSEQVSARVNHVQDVVDGAFMGAVNPTALQSDLAGTPASPQVVGQTLNQMVAVDRAPRITSRVLVVLDHGKVVIASALGPNPDTDLGPGATDRDPLAVFDDAQVAKFVR